MFYVKGEKAGVLDTPRYLRAHLKPDFATQSGPMLVIEGQIHPKISADGPSQKIRNGVGTRDGGHVAVFAISERPVSFGAFAGCSATTSAAATPCSSTARCRASTRRTSGAPISGGRWGR